MSAEPRLRDNLYIQIIRFEIDPEKSEILLAAILEQVEAWVKHCDGFISANFHLSADRTQVINYAQWRDEAAFQAFLNRPEREALQAAIEGAGPTASATAPFRLVKSVQSAGV